MSNTPVYTDKSASPPERRHHVRRDVRALAYLDIGADNGGIVLNLSEEGMAFQAVGRLDGQTDLSLRIQLPESRTRIKTAAQIVWLSESNREAGVRFVDMPSEGRAQIHAWVRSQISLNAPSEETLGARELASEPPRKQETLQESRKFKWISLMAKSEVPEPEHQIPPRIAGAPEERPHAPIERETAAMFPAPGFASGRLFERAKRPHEPLRPREVPPQGVPNQPRTEPPTSGPDRQPNGQNSGYAPISVPSHHRADSEGVLDRPIPTSRTVAPTEPKRSTRAPASAELSASGVVSKANPAVPETTKKSGARKWAGVSVLLASLSILCFGIGTWLGSLGTRFHSAQTPAPPAAAMPVTAPGTTGSNERNANELPSAIANRTRAAHAGGNSPLENRKRNLALPTSSPPVLPVQPIVQSTPTRQSLTPSTDTKPPESDPVPAPVRDDSAAVVPAATIVAGRTLRPTDRFNPCHLTYRVEPAYPLVAQQQRIEGAVKIHLVIGADGTVRSMKLLSGSPLLVPAAMDAAKYWQYLPALLNGQPVETEQDIEIAFRLSH